MRCRVAEKLPEASRDQFLADIKARIEEKSEKEIAQTYKDVLRQLGTGSDPGLEILRALASQRNSNGKH